MVNYSFYLTSNLKLKCIKCLIGQEVGARSKTVFCCYKLSHRVLVYLCLEVDKGSLEWVELFTLIWMYVYYV